VGLGRETRHTADRPDDLGGQYGTHAEDLYEAGAGSFYLGFDTPIEVCDLSLQCPDVAYDLRSQPPADAGRGALRSYAAQDADGSGGRECPRDPATNEVSQEESVQAVERSGVRSATKSPRLSESSRSTSEPASGSTVGSRSLRQAASAVARASSPSFFGALPLESTRTRAESLGGTSTTDSPAAANLWDKCLPRPPAFSTAQRRSANRLA
jgi:hypothetical protein